MSSFFISQNFFGKEVEQDADFKNFILIGWDGAKREHVYNLLKNGRLPNLESLISKGAIVDTSVTTGSTHTKPGWAEILTGYNAETLGIYNNLDYKPIPKGYTVFERLKDYFGKDNISTLFVGGKIDNIGGRGPHKICTNCITRYPDTREKTFYKEGGTTAPTYQGQERILEDREGEPYYYTKDSLDVFEVALRGAENVGPKALDYIEKYKKERFFAFFHFEEPDELGHKFTGGSPEYLESIIVNDRWLGEIMSTLKEFGIYGETLIYVTTDHGFNDVEVNHNGSPDIFLATNDPKIKKSGDRKDITPTILERYGMDINIIEPAMDGVSLIKEPPTRIGYFHGGRVNMIYRTLIYDYFAKEGIDVELYTKFLKEEELFKVPHSELAVQDMLREKTDHGNPFGKMSGIEIVDKMMTGELDGGTIGESSFIASINKGLPIVAVAMLGYDAVPGKAIIMRKGIKIDSPDDFKGKTLISRRAGPGDAIFLREFLKDIGLVANKDLTVIDQVDEDDGQKWLKEGVIDGGLYHLTTVRHMVQSGVAYVYRTMDWMDSATSNAVLVFRKDYVESNREEVQKVVDAYVKRVAYEKSLPDEEKDRSWNKGLMMEGEFEGMLIPAYDLPPRIRFDLLQEVQRLLLEYGEIDKKVDLNEFIDNSFVERALSVINQ